MSNSSQPRKTLVVLTGAGMSAESGIPTFRDAGGLWEGHRVEDVATPDAWERNPTLVLDFYNQRRRKLAQVVPNDGHLGLARLDERFDVRIITQNVDDLHERAGSRNVLHLHGRLTQARSTIDENVIIDIGYRDIAVGEKCPHGSQLRPNIVWFGEPVPLIDKAIEIAERADYMVIIGTSLAVYPAAGLINYAPPTTPIFYIDPYSSTERTASFRNMHHIAAGGSEGVRRLAELLK